MKGGSKVVATALKQRSRMAYFALAAAVPGAVALGGCTHYQAVGISLSGRVVDDYGVTTPFQGEACRSYLFGLIPLGGNPDTIAAALPKRAGTALTQVAVDVKSTYWIVGSTRCVIVSGFEVRPRTPAKAAEEKSEKRRRATAERAIQALQVGQTVRILLKDGTVHRGVVRGQNDIIVQLDTADGSVSVYRHLIQSVNPQTIP